MPQLSQTKIQLARTRRVENSPATVRKLIDAAGEVFAESGYYAATVREICKRAGTNVAAVNYHFGDKLGLYTAVLKQSLRAAKLQAIYGALEKSGPPEQILRAVIRVRLKGLQRLDLANWQFRLLIHELAQPTPALSRVVNEVSRPIYDRLLKVIGEIIGQSPEDEKTRLCAHSVMGQILVYMLARPVINRLWPELKMTDEQVERIADHIADFSLAYLNDLGAERRKLHAKVN
jgi:TetR/AcrR family transcriptional regulator, regulator of cefoperazone and chloramphenicol sensitivity